MRVVIDTNVFVSSFFGDKPKKIIDLWKKGKIILCLSENIITEYIEVLYRLMGSDTKDIKDLLDLFSQGINILFTKSTPKLHVIKKDPDDNKFIECAVKLKADFIVTGDKALKEINQYFNIKILSPSDFLDDIHR